MLFTTLHWLESLKTTLQLLIENIFRESTRRVMVNVLGCVIVEGWYTIKRKKNKETNLKISKFKF